MKTLIIPDVEAPIPIQRALRRPGALPLVARGRSCPRAANFLTFPCPPRGAGLVVPGRPGRPAPDQLFHVIVVLRHDPSVFGLCGGWDGKMPSWRIKKELVVDVPVHHCQKMFHDPDFDLEIKGS